MYFRSQMEAIKTISLIGAGNVGVNLGKSLKKAGYTFNCVYSRSIDKARQLATALETNPVNELDEVVKSDMTLLAIPDIAIVWVAERLSHDHPFLVHVSGSTSLDTVKQYASQSGVLYPLQTFSVFKEIDFSDIPLCIEGSSENATQQLNIVASAITKDVRKVNSRQRLSIHLAAVFSSNFVNYLNIEATDILEKAGVSRDILFPLMRETLNKLLEYKPKDAQTGPAVRKDHGTMAKHIEMLNLHPDKQKIYRILSEQIQRTFED